MVAWLSGWLKEIILVVLLAAFVDLLLPNNAFQRYVKTVLGLFILLTLLSPILAVFKEKWDTGKLLASVETLGTGRSDSGIAGQMRSLQSIMADAERWRQSNRAETQQLLEQQLAAELSRTVRAELPVQVKRVSLQMDYDNNGTPRIERMQVVLDDIDSASGAFGSTGDPDTRSGAAPGRPIGKVEPVHIDIRIGEAQSKAKAGEGKPTFEQQQAKQRIYELLYEQWQLSRDQVTLIYESELRKER